MESRNNTSSILVAPVDITNTSTNVDILALPVAANKRYKVEAWLGPISAVCVDVALVLPSGATFTGRSVMNSSQGSMDFAYDATTEIDGTFFYYGQDSNANLAIEGILTTGLTCDVLKVQAGQSTADATVTEVPSGSYLIVTPLD